ncbi:hypothetical protein QQS21_000578 [Conoideocrella luteorostrata]|uniref:chitinase n=1 Tax=Conoideocrella luteorostrata TaxID=1105319 RepID=A0AAJ0FZ55_9HYPO|nr:hypothetical protein QQS21_000578 [Conoideocrella luteorostrata]
MWSITAALLLSARLVLAAINIDGSQAVEPAYENDFSPISDISTYQIDQHECPLPCVDYSNPHSWIPYSSVGRLKRCQQPMLLQFSVSQPLSDPQSNIIIRSCTLNPAEHGSIMASAAEAASIVENPKKLDESAKYGGLESTSVACSTSGMQLPGKIEVVTSTRKTPNSSDAVDLLKGMRQFFAAKDNCDEKFLFGYHNQFVAGVYIGEHITKSTADSALAALSKQLQSDNSVPDQAIVQYYDNGRQPDSIFGIFIDNNRNLSAVQQTILGWSQGNYANGVLGSKGVQSGAKLFGVVQHNGTSSGNGTSLTSNLISRLLRTQIRPVNRADKRAVCRSVQVVEHDTCAILAERCGITPYAFSKFNSKPNFCSTLQPRDTACCSSGSVPKPDSPQAGPDGSCASHLIRNGDSCFAVSKKYGVTVEDLEKWNKGKTWAWTECKDMLVGYSMCVSKGTPPMPPPQMGTQCGPLVPGTKPPTNSSVSLADLNPCPLKACCSNWGFCGVFPGHCAINAPEGGGPGTKKKGFQSTCISNCETKIKQNSGPPVSFQRIGYYESFNLERECLWLKAKNANTDGTYTHIHWGFASIDPNTWMPVVNNTKNQWSSFKELTGVKKILSFGGWAYSTEPATYNIIRSAIIDNRNTFAANLAKFAKDEGFDGIDIDWEYPGVSIQAMHPWASKRSSDDCTQAPDILVGGKPIGQKRDGIDYLKFLTVLKKQLGPEKSVSIAAPASFWYLQAFPIDRIAAVVDYIVYMTYDLHGQWDYGNVNAFDSCASGKCIRSHGEIELSRVIRNVSHAPLS